MKKIFSVVFLIFGMVVGSGFSSGKEIMVFFSRFGAISYFYIFLASILFFAVFYFFLIFGDRLSNIFDNSKLLSFFSAFISLIFCSSMFAGIESLFENFSPFFYVVLIVLLLFFCVFITFKGIKGFEKFNFYLMPFTSFIFLLALVFCLTLSSEISFSVDSWAGILYSFLYVALNSSMSGVVLSKIGKGLSKKQVFLSCLFSSFLIFIFLILGNLALQKNNISFTSDMPFIFLTKNNPLMFVLTFGVVFVGCFTTLISQTLTLSSFFEKYSKSKILPSIASVLLPFFISSFGFSKIVSLLYPLCSVFAIFVFIFLIIKFFKVEKL